MKVYRTQEHCIEALAPLYIKCQQQDIHKIQDGIAGHGPRRVHRFTVDNFSGMSVILSCGCCLPISWMPIWESEACLKFKERIDFLFNSEVEV